MKPKLKVEENKFVNSFSVWAMFYTPLVLIFINVILCFVIYFFVPAIYFILIYGFLIDLTYLNWFFVGLILIFFGIFGRRIAWKYHNWESFIKYENAIKSYEKFAKILALVIIIVALLYFVLGAIAFSSMF